MDKTTIINYQMGNIGSVAKKVKKMGCEPVIATRPEQVLQARRLILPGVGHFASAVDKLKSMELWDALNEVVLQRKVPILGICLGMQLMAKHSEEGDCEGLGWFDAEVVRFNINDKIKYKVPHTGWNTLDIKQTGNLLEGVASTDEFYFVHSYYVKCKNKENVGAVTNYESTFDAVIQKENIYGVQFHPEKSHDIGEKLLLNFLKI